jgi:ATP-binding cassette subfamily B protein
VTGHAPNIERAPLLARVRDNCAYAAKTIRLVWRASRRQTLALGALAVTGGLAPLGLAFAAKSIVDGIVARDAPSALRWLLVEFGCVAALAGCERGNGLLRGTLGARLGLDVNAKVLAKAVGLELSFFEDPSFRDRLARAQNGAATRPVGLVLEAFGLAQSLVTLLGYAVVAARFSLWAIVAICAATIPATLAEIRFSRVAFGVRNARSAESRRQLYLEFLLSDDKHAKEVKLFGLGRMLFDRHARLGERLYDEECRLQVRRAGWTLALSLVGTASVYATYAVIVAMGARGGVTLGAVTLYVLALRQGQQAFQSSLGTIGRIYEHGLYMSNLWAYLDTSGPPALTRTARRAIEASGSPAGIVLDAVSFRYPGEDAWALRDVSMAIPAGGSVALVGENGAGKSTLVKLMTRLYEPTEGRILLDGKDLRDWNVDDLHRRFGVVFQDFNRYQLSIRENVSMGSVQDAEDDVRIRRAIERGGASDVVARQSEGLDAQLGHFFEGGAELSGGEWQKLALSRAFMRENADILVLDEPTAALDAEAEHAAFDRFRRLSEGRTTIMISHRFSTVRTAEQIIVLEGGGIRERGTHDELVRIEGTYARMFALQAAGYR